MSELLPVMPAMMPRRCTAPTHSSDETQRAVLCGVGITALFEWARPTGYTCNNVSKKKCNPINVKRKHDAMCSKHASKRDLADERVSRFTVPFSSTAIIKLTPFSIPCNQETHLNGTSLFDILLTGSLVLADEVCSSISSEPIGQLWEFLAKTIDWLVIHVGLSNQLRKRDLGRKYCVKQLEE